MSAELPRPLASAVRADKRLKLVVEPPLLHEVPGTRLPARHACSGHLPPKVSDCDLDCVYCHLQTAELLSSQCPVCSQEARPCVPRGQPWVWHVVEKSELAGRFGPQEHLARVHPPREPRGAAPRGVHGPELPLRPRIEALTVAALLHDQRV